VHAGGRIAAHDQAGRERLLRYCARLKFAGELVGVGCRRGTRALPVGVAGIAGAQN